MLLAHCGRLSHCLSGGQSKRAGPYSVGLSVSLLYRFVASIVFPRGHRCYQYGRAVICVLYFAGLLYCRNY